MHEEGKWIDAADYARLVEKEQGCDREGCLGNRLFWATDAEGVKTLKVDLPHHKNFNAWDAQSMAFTLPEPLAGLFRRYLKWGHKILTEYQGKEDVRYCFIDVQGRPFSDATFCLYWQGWLQKTGGVRVSPQEVDEEVDELVIDLTFEE
ncbi:hypothetical protein WJX72_006903 [[Myrmecia] bisecta]|uniref:Uncharacterized protein n=1 Tax=[Myrmecia] bisecta TaxID=41462 RepID=A0AAW1Q1M7_9CHLO